PVLLPERRRRDRAHRGAAVGDARPGHAQPDTRGHRRSVPAQRGFPAVPAGAARGARAGRHPDRRPPHHRADGGGGTAATGHRLRARRQRQKQKGTDGVKIKLLVVSVLALLSVVTVATSLSAPAAPTFAVNSTADVVDATRNGTCATAGGA